MFDFALSAVDGSARAGSFSTPHGDVETPSFMPVGTGGTVKGLVTEELEALGARVVLANTYHLYLRPGHELVRDLGGLHDFMRWDGPILTDSADFRSSLSLGSGRSTTTELNSEATSTGPATDSRRSR